MMLNVPKTEVSVQKLLDLLRCDGCGRTLHEPFTTGACEHTLCSDCCRGVRSRLVATKTTKPKSKITIDSCPRCKTPLRPCDVKPHPQLSSLVLVARRLAKLLRLPLECTSEETTQLSGPESVGLRDNIDFLNADDYCRVASPSPSPISCAESKTNIKCHGSPQTETAISAVALSPISCSLKHVPQLPEVVIAENVPKIEAEEEIIETTSAVMPPPPPGVKAPRRRSLRKSNNLQSPCSSPGASNSCSSIKSSPRKKAPLASPEKSYLAEDYQELSLPQQEQQTTTENSKKALKRSASGIQRSKKPSKPTPPSGPRNVRKSKSVPPLKRIPTSTGADPELRVNSKGESVLHRAALKNDLELVRRLLQSGVSANVRDHAGWTPLHEAALKGYTELAECLLVEGGAGVDLPGGPDLETPLHDAVSNGRLDCVRLLLQHKANPGLANNRGISPLQQCANMFERAEKDIRENPTTTKKRAQQILKSIHQLLMEAAKARSLDKPADSLVKLEANSTDLSASAMFIERRRLRPVMLGTGLSRPQRAQFSRVAALIHARIATEMSPEVTHLITGITSTPAPHNPKGGAGTKGGQRSKTKKEAWTPASEPGVTCPRTLKFLFAVLQGCWVLSFDWVETCEMVKMRVEEEAFEVTGCSSAPMTGASTKARQAREAGSAGLFHGFRFCLLGNFEYPTPSRTDISALATTGGATVLSRDITSASRLAYFAVDNPVIAANWRVQQDQNQPSLSPSAAAAAPQTPLTYTVSTVPLEANQLIALFDPRASGLCSGAANSIIQVASQSLTSANSSNSSRPDLLVAEALAMLQPQNAQDKDLTPPIRLVPATWIMDCVAAYAIAPPPEKVVW